MVVTGIGVLIVEFLIRNYQIASGIELIKYSLTVPCSPFSLLASVFIFAGISYISIHKDFSKLAALTFYIYLFHAGIWDVLWRGIRAIFGEAGGDNRIMILISVSLVFMISLLCSILYTKIWNILELRYKISDRICKWAGQSMKAVL